jgi:predicted DNA-binding transcriptional regulator AlpA
MDTISREYLKTSQAAKIVSLSVSTLNKLRLTGGGPRYAKLGASVRYELVDLLDWAERSKKPNTSAPRR